MQLSVPSSLGMGRSPLALFGGALHCSIDFQSPLHWGWVVHQPERCPCCGGQLLSVPSSLGMGRSHQPGSPRSQPIILSVPSSLGMGRSLWRCVGIQTPSRSFLSLFLWGGVVAFASLFRWWPLGVFFCTTFS